MNPTLQPSVRSPTTQLRPHPDWSALRVTGPDRAAWLEGLVTCAVKALRPQSGAFGLLLSRQGKIQSPLWLLCATECLWVLVPSSERQAIFDQLDQRLVMEDAELAPDDTQAWYSLHGPAAVGVASGLASRHGGVAAQLPVCATGDAVVGVPVGQTQELNAERAEWSELGDEGWALLRLRAGLPQFGLDYGPEDRPHEASLDRRAVDWTKGCYLGQEVVCMQDLRGKVKRRVRSLVVELAPGAPPPQPPLELATGNATRAGRVTSLVYDAAEKRFLGLGQVDLRAADSAGAQLALLANGVHVEAKVQLVAEVTPGAGSGAL